MASDEELAAQLAKDLAYCISPQSRYQVAREIIRTVRKDEREACAKVGDDYALTWSRSNKPEAETTYNVCRTIARAIRARTP